MKRIPAFKAYDIRGVYGVDFTADQVYRIGYFLPGLMNTGKVLVGRDCRLSSDEIHAALIRGLMDAGADVYDAGLSTTPMIYFGTAFFNFGLGIQITASHNPASHNGFKVSGPGASPVGYDNGLQKLEELVLKADITLKNKRGNYESLNVRDPYLEFLRSYIPDSSNLKIGVDCSNGMAALLVGKVLPGEVYYINDVIDGRFPGHDPNPLNPQNLEGLKHLVTRNRLDLGIIFDGDADRVMFLDEHGSFIPPDLVIALLGHHFLKEGPGKVLVDIRTSRSVTEYLEKLGAEVYMWKVGRAFAAPRLRELQGVFGGELAGHYYFRDFFYSDSGILACLLVLGSLGRFKAEGKSVSEVFASITKYSNSGEINFLVENKQNAMDAVIRHFLATGAVNRVLDFDGFRLEAARWWLNLRPSNTEPYLRFIAEADDTVLLNEIIKEVRQIIEKVNSGN